MKKMTKAEARAKALVAGMSTAKILDVFEATTDKQTSVELAMTRGWLLDEIEKRFPEEFDRWLDSETCEDAELRTYIDA